MSWNWSHEGHKEYIKLPECKARGVYKISSRNLSYGIYDGKSGFIGIRTKFSDRYLFTEYHWDNDRFPTVQPLEYLGIDLPDNIPITPGLQPVDDKTGRPVEFDKPIKEGGRGWYFKDTNQASEDIWPVHVQNKDMFNFLEEIEKKYGVE